MYGIDRALANAPTRRKGKHQKRLGEDVESSTVKPDGTETPVRLKRGQLPRVLSWIEMPVPGRLRGVDPDIDESVVMRVQFQPTVESDQHAINNGYKNLKLVSQPIDETAFVRLLAKIGHSYAVAELGLTGFTPFLLPLILGATASRTYYVGGFEPQQRQSRSALTLTTLKHTGETLAIVEVSLHMFPHLPRYQVVVGSMSEA